MSDLPKYMIYLFLGSFGFGLLVLLSVMRFSKKSIFFMDDAEAEDDEDLSENEKH